MRRFGLSLLALVLVSGVIGACSSQDSGGDDAAPAQELLGRDASEQHVGAAKAVTGDGYNTSGGGAASGVAEYSAADTDNSQVGRSLLQTPRIGPSVIKTADIEVEVARGDFQDALNQSVGLAGRYG
ncbi:MAG: hypothetical protein ACRDKZ_16225, partial [Actinomycetota bacterium]